MRAFVVLRRQNTGVLLVQNKMTKEVIELQPTGLRLHKDDKTEELLSLVPEPMAHSY